MGSKGVLGGLGGSEVLSQKENPCGRGPKVGGGGLKCSGTRVSVGGGKMIKKYVLRGLKVGVLDSKKINLFN